MNYLPCRPLPMERTAYSISSGERAGVPSEKFHGAVVDHKNGSNTRVFRDVAALGNRLEGISERVLKTCNRPKAALVFDWENWWAADDAMAVTMPFDYRDKCADYYTVFWEKGIDVDIINMDDSLNEYSLVIAPVNYMYRGDYIENVKQYVKNGGTYVTTYWSGEVDESDLCFLKEHPLRELLGIRTEEIDVRPQHIDNHIVYKGEKYEIKDLCALVHAESAKVLATYEKDFYAGYPALTENTYGKGKAYFVAAEGRKEFLSAFYDALFEETGIACNLKATFPSGVTVSERCGEKPEDSLWFVMNFNSDEAAVEFQDRYSDIETGNEIMGHVVLPAYQCLILQKEEN